MSEEHFRRFLSRSVISLVAVTGFAALAWADATSFAGAPPAWWLLPLALAVAVGGMDELVRLFAADDLVLPGWILRPAVAAIVLVAAFAAPAPASSPSMSLAGPAVVFTGAMTLLFAREIATYRPGGRSMARLAAGVLAVAYVGLPMAFLVALRLVCVEHSGAEDSGPGHLGIVPLASLVAIVKAGDIAAYVVGSVVGRTKMAPLLSPGKTWEGAAASLVASMAASWLVLERLGAGIAVKPLGGWAAYGLAVGAAGMIGDLAESLLKRETGAKDSGRSLAALGGVLDLADSLLLAAPVAWILWVLRPPVPA